jgi:phosphohistidine phosphatase
MKTLFILRHAKSSWKDAGLADFERPLNSRGLDEAAFMGTWIFRNEIQPDLFISSPAKRARQTAILVRETAQISAKIQYDERIYEASQLTLLNILGEIDDKYETVLLVGHNPGLEGLIKILSGELLAFHTAGLAKINLQIEKWSDVAPASGKLELLMYPNHEIRIFKAS